MGKNFNIMGVIALGSGLSANVRASHSRRAELRLNSPPRYNYSILCRCGPRVHRARVEIGKFKPAPRLKPTTQILAPALSPVWPVIVKGLQRAWATIVICHLFLHIQPNTMTAILLKKTSLKGPTPPVQSPATFSHSSFFAWKHKPLCHVLLASRLSRVAFLNDSSVYFYHCKK